MQNILSYYYNLYPTNIEKKDSNYYFEYNSTMYVFKLYDRPESDIQAIYDLNKKMILVDKIILNKDENVITSIDDKKYILLEKVFSEDNVTLKDICYLNNTSINIKCSELLNRMNWVSLWESKNDYIESQLQEINKKYNNLTKYVNYYIGISENACLYTKKALSINGITLSCVCHKRINPDLYDPLDFIYDYRVRDAAEYIKTSFFNDKDSMLLVKEYFDNNYLSYKEALLFYARLLYPSYFFDLYEDIINESLDENLINKIIIKAEKYELFLSHTEKYISSLYNSYIPLLNWLKKEDASPLQH